LTSPKKHVFAYTYAIICHRNRQFRANFVISKVKIDIGGLGMLERIVERFLNQPQNL
jgi:hypothetical protein